MDLSKIGERERLKPRPGDEPHWQRLRFGCFVGYRPSQLDGRGTWFARAYDSESSKYKRKALGDFGSLNGHAVFAAAKQAAEVWADTVETGGVTETKIVTVNDACKSYAKDRPDAEARFSRLVYDDPLGRVRLDKLRRHHVDDWRRRLEQQPALVSRRRSGDQLTRPRAPATINRDMVPLRAALAKVLAPGAPGSTGAWQEALGRIRNADRQRTLFLDLEQRRRLLVSISEEAAPFVRALCLLPLRPGAMANLSVGDYDTRTRELTIGKDKSGKPRRIIIPESAAQFFYEQLKGRPATDPLFRRANGKRWCRETWNDPIKRASKAAGCGRDVTAYVFRHSVITDLVNGGLAILTIAQISDTSVEMIERHYGHLNRAAAEQALSALAL